jgi:protein ImuB
MVIPSYDDLTPGIPDVVDSETVTQLEVFLRDDLGRRSDDQEQPRKSPGLPPSVLYACLRTTSPGRPTADRELLAIARDFSPRVMCAGDRDILLDVSGLGRLIGDPSAIRRELRRAVARAGADAFVAIAPTQTIARLLAHAGTATGHGLTRRHQDRKGHKDHEETLNRLCDLCWPVRQLPVQLLRELEVLPPGINQRDRLRPYETLARWGIATLGDLAALPAAALSSRLGRRGVALQRLARGLDPRPFVPDPETPRFMDRLELEWPIEELEPLSFVLARLLEPLSAALERAHRGAAAIHLELRLTDRTAHTRVLQLPAPIRDARVLRTLLLLDLESGPPSAAIDVVAIELDPAPARITQFSLLQRALPSPETLSTLTARLSALVGESRVGSPALIDSHAPDAFAMERFAPVGTARVAPVGAEGAEGAEGARGAGPGGALVLRRQRVPPAIRVSVEQGRPVYLAPSRRGVPYGTVVQAAGPWRSSGGWWEGAAAHRAEGGADAGRAERPVPPKPRRGERGWNRDEWDVALKSGAVCRIYRDRTTERWFLEGIYD